MKYTYLLINLLLLAFPMALSFDKKVRFFRYWKFMVPGLLIAGLVYLVWNHFYSLWGVWTYNERYVTGARIWGVPIEEILFFFSLPVAFTFIYEVARQYIERDYIRVYGKFVTWGLILVMAQLVFFHNHRLYTAVPALLLLFLLLLHQLVIRKPYTGRFYMAYLVSLLLLLLVNGILAGLPVISYDRREMLSFRLFSIPLENFIYDMVLLLINIMVYEGCIGDRTKRFHQVEEEVKG